MEFVIIFLVLIIAILAAAIFIVVRKKPENNNQPILMLQEQISNIGKTLDSKLAESNRAMQNQFGQSIKVISEVTEKLTKLDETNRQVMGFADQLQSLENILKNPKQRGNFGEYALDLLLERAFTPNQYAKQYEFKNGDRVDFAIFIGDKILPIDSKFSLENYNKIVNENDPIQKEQLEKIFKQDLKIKIDQTSKYIRPSEGTFDFALMFIPAEGIYYDLMVNEVGAVKVNTRNLLEYAVWDKNVHIVSPNSFYAFLQTILQGLRAFRIEESAKGIRNNVETLSRHLNAFDSYFQKIGNNLGTVVNSYNTAYKEFGKIDKDVIKITEGERTIEPLQIDKPTID